MCCQHMGRLKVCSDEGFRVSSTGTMTWSGQHPWVRGNKVLIACSGGFYQFSLDTYSFGKYLK